MKAERLIGQYNSIHQKFINKLEKHATKSSEWMERWQKWQAIINNWIQLKVSDHAWESHTAREAAGKIKDKLI